MASSMDTSLEGTAGTGLGWRCVSPYGRSRWLSLGRWYRLVTKSSVPQYRDHSVLIIIRSLGSRDMPGALKTQKNVAELLNECASPAVSWLRMDLPSGGTGVSMR